jgi:hypothetical protein
LHNCSFNFFKVSIWNHRPEKAHTLAKELGVSAVDDVQQAVKDADVIVTVTCSSKPVLMAEWVKPGAHINGMRKFLFVVVSSKIKIKIGKLFFFLFCVCFFLQFIFVVIPTLVLTLAPIPQMLNIFHFRCCL